jgi:uncharacterized protein YceH (UPF0502 family)
VDLRPAEIRVLGCLVEKQRTTPDQYPLSVNALRLACNQATNRDPVVDYDEETVVDALQRLGRRGMTRLASGAGSRARKYRHLADEALGLAAPELAILTVLMLRGPQTPGELKQRAERLAGFADLDAVAATLERLIGRGLVEALPRRPGQKEQRFEQLLGADAENGAPAAAPSEPPAAASVDVAPAGADGLPAADAPAAADPLAERVASLEREVGELRTALESLRAELGVS